MSTPRARCGSGTDVRKVTCSVHQGRDCQPCILCKKGNQSKYFHPKSWKDDSLLQSLREYEPCINIIYSQAAVFVGHVGMTYLTSPL